MAAEAPDEFDALVDALDDIVGTPFGTLRTSLASEIARRAEGYGGALAYYALLQEAESAMFGGSPRLAVTAFVKALGGFEQLPEPSAYTQDRLLRHFKWLLEECVGVAELPKEQIDNLIDDYERRVRAFGSNGREPLLVRRTWAIHRWAADEVAELQARLTRLPRDPLEDCSACEVDRWSRWLADRGDHKAALKAAQQVVTGELKCSEVPGRTFAGLLNSWRTIGDRAAADDAHRRGLRLCGSNPYYLGPIGQHIEHLAVTDRLPMAMRLLNRNLEAAHEAESTVSALWFWRGARAVLTRTEKAAKITATEATAALMTAAQALDERNGSLNYRALVQNDAK
jgi:cellulose synthase operon protein C